MICYKDRTFCGFFEKCVHGETCRCALTEEVENNARKANLLISQFCEEPECFEPM